jgi:hypothetical protein
MSESFPNQNEGDVMNLSVEEFDQTMKGWRKFEQKKEYIKAADVISKYMVANEEKIYLSQDEEGINFDLMSLNFHRGQALAAAGRDHWTDAIDSFKKAFLGPDVPDGCWNAYVAATIGFLEGDTGKIEEAIRTIESSRQEDKRAGNIDIVRNFKKGLEEGVRDYETVYGW